MTISTVGVKRFKVYGVLLLVNTVVLALSGHINHFQEFFYIADVFPFVLSLITMVFVPAMMFLDVKSQNAFTGRPPFELGWLFVLGTLWLSFNAFSTNRWRYIDMGLCRTIPGDAQYASYRTWCHELQALRAFVWIEWVMFLLTFALLLRWTLHQHQRGRTDVWTVSFSRFPAYPPPGSRYRGETNSEFLQWEKFPAEGAVRSPLESPRQQQQLEQQAALQSSHAFLSHEQTYPPAPLQPYQQPGGVVEEYPRPMDRYRQPTYGPSYAM